MTFKDALRDSMVNGFLSTDMTTAEILITMGVTFIIAFYIFIVYRLITQNAFYSKSFNIATVAISVVTAGIIMAMQSSLVISLGMVGALSIVRFRTAIKEPMDLLFLFWSIGTGIICGAGLYKIGVILAVCVTITMVLLQLLPERKASNILFASSSDKGIEKEMNTILAQKTQYFKIKSRNITGEGIDFVYEVKSKNETELVTEISAMPAIKAVSLIAHDGEFRG